MTRSWALPPRLWPLADAIAKALGLSAAQRAGLAERAIAHARSHFGIERMCAETLAVYREILSPSERAVPIALDPEAA